MDNTEIHYVTYDPEEIWRAGMDAYMEAGGDVLYPGDEKEMLLRGVQNIIVHTFASVDVALRMDTRRYAVGPYLDLYGEKRYCERTPAAAATAKVEIKFKASGNAKTIAAGTAMTADGERIYLLTEDITQTGFEQSITTTIICQEKGGLGNGLLAGMQMQLMIPNPAVQSIFVTEDASGGQDAEEEEIYRERIGTHGLISTTTGAAAQYESVAMAVTSEILDAKALNEGAGRVGVYLLLASTVGEAAILNNVQEALTPLNMRPLTDTISVYKAAEKPYVLNVQYRQETGTDATAKISAAVKEYQEWQDRSIGRAFNPDKLMAMIYQAGAIRVVWAEGSHFDNGSVEYSTIPKNACCKGKITLAVMDA